MDEEKLSAEESQVLDALKEIIDPELGIDLVNLGLIYDVTVTGKHCDVTMTLTTMGCPIGNVLASQISQAVMSVPVVETCDLNLVWEPAWNIDMMSRYAKVALGVHG
ncbi:hypothetical protein FC99_GL002043 [Levilactobacillus koreensis JCM 16448]|uniref:DNA methyltransferase n=1 Tax=Levilactobacillus koreensis TaxID=637971 RepID=A0AAC8UWB4_9LACO|nr:metal-sulfur cluster assembly factor [Levilactobacillus koreensis]AKP64867.1 DNA methyltransferase [Levilactobacillus koreensis]KRK85951.1 hypothetical protein FC99_GL002043 [Levilactobacillus koreensis JCM 16448]